MMPWLALDCESIRAKPRETACRALAIGTFQVGPPDRQFWLENESLMKFLLIFLGFLSAILVVAQMVLGLLIRGGEAHLRTAHFHSGSMMVLVTLLYIGFSLSYILGRSRKTTLPE